MPNVINATEFGLYCISYTILNISTIKMVMSCQQNTGQNHNLLTGSKYFQNMGSTNIWG